VTALGDSPADIPHKPAAIVAAMRMELAPLLDKRQPRKVNGVALFNLEWAVVAIGGMGEYCARHAAETVIAEFQPRLLVSAGIAGAISSMLKVGDVGRIREVVEVATGQRYPTNSGEWVLVTVPEVSHPAGKRELRARFGADVVDMEAAAVAQVAQQRGVGFAAVKSVSEEAGFRLPPLQRFIGPKGRFHSGRFLFYVALRPQWWPALARMRKNTTIAATNLCYALEHLLVDSG